MKTIIYKGQVIKKDKPRWELRGHAWGDGPGEYHRFKTLKETKEFIDRHIDEWNDQK